MSTAAKIRVVVACAVLLGACVRSGRDDDAALLDATAPQLAAELAAGRLTSERLVRATLARIAALDDAGPELNAIIEIAPDAIETARSLDRRFAASGPVGRLHGLPVVLKANIDTADGMATSAGSLALARHRARADAELVTRLRRAGAVIVAKANLSEWARFRALRAVSGWSSLGGQTKNPYVLDHSPCGSSSGSAVAVAARLVPLAVGTETDGSIVCPAAMNGIVGVKPTHGSVSAAGIIPIARSQDVAGPMARSVAGAALLLAAMQDEAAAARIAAADLGRADLDGVRLGVLRDYAGAGEAPMLEAHFEGWLAILAARGAAIVDPLRLELPQGVRQAEFEVMLFEFRAGIEDYLGSDPAWPDTLAELIEFNARNAETVMPHFGQDLFELAQQRGDLDSPQYAAALAGSQSVVRQRLRTVFAAEGLDALLAPVTEPAFPIDPVNGDAFTVNSAYVAAMSGYPSVAVPGGTINGLPIALAFIGRPGTEASLLELAAVFEAAVGPLPAPQFRPSIDAPTTHLE